MIDDARGDDDDEEDGGNDVPVVVAGGTDGIRIVSMTSNTRRTERARNSRRFVAVGPPRWEAVAS